MLFVLLLTPPPSLFYILRMYIDQVLRGWAMGETLTVPMWGSSSIIDGGFADMILICFFSLISLPAQKHPQCPREADLCEGIQTYII